MAGFLRKKKHDSVVPPPAPVSPVVDAPQTPLFARFATTLAEPPAQRVVSSPMALASSPRNDQASRMTNGEGAVRGAQQHEDNRTRYPVQPSYVQGNAPGSSNSTAASASIGNAQSYGSPAKNGVSSPRTRNQTMPTAAAASSPPNRRFSQVPGADKPLPSIYPQDNRPDPLGSHPPQSSLPAGRRASTRGTPSAATQNLPNGRVMAAPAQQPPHSAHPPTRSPSNAGSPQPATRALPPSASQTHSPPRPNPTPGPSQDPSRFPKEYARQDLRHKLSDAGSASGGPSAIPSPASPPRQNSPARWAPEGRTPTSYQDPDASLTLPNSKSRAPGITPAPTPPPPLPEPHTDMGATISSFEVQSFHPGDSFKINTGLLPAQHIAPANHSPKGPKRTPSQLVKGKPLIFAAMESTPSEKADYNPYNAYPSPPTEVVKMPPRLLSEESDTVFDTEFSKTVMESWAQQQQRPPQQPQPQQPPPERQTPKVNGYTPPPNVRQTPRLNGTHLPPLTTSQQPQFAAQVQPQRVPTKKDSRHQIYSPPSTPQTRPTPPPEPQTPTTPHTPRTLTKPRPTTPQRKMSAAALQQPSPSLLAMRDSTADERTPSRASTLMLDDDPFAKVDPVRMLKPVSRDGPPVPATPPPPPSVADAPASPTFTEPEPATPRQERSFAEERDRVHDHEFEEDAEPQNAVNLNGTPPQKTHAPPSPVTPEEYRHARSRRRGDHLEKAPPPSVAGVEVRETRMPGPFPLAACVEDPQLLSALLVYLSFYDWCILSAVTKEIRMRLVGTAELREAALERYLRTVGYSRWAWEDPDPLELSLLDLHDYMRGVSLPTHEYSRVAEMYVQSFGVPPDARDPTHLSGARNLTMSTRAYTRVVLRLRAQAEREASDAAALKALGAAPPPVPSKKRITSNGYASSRSSPSRTSSRAPSPNSSSHSNGHQSGSGQAQQARPSAPGTAFRSPLFRVKRAPLLRVFVPSPDGDWLSDKSVLECEAELKRAGVLALLRIGDVVWDIAVGDEGNIGRLVWDGSYLIDLDYKYSAVGDLPQYLPTLAFPPSYFHRVIRTGPASTNPIVHVDISPWGQEIAANLQLLQDRVRTETPQGNIHNVVRWVHRSSFVVRAPPKHPRASMNGGRNGRPPSPARIPIPESAGLFVDPGWYGTIVVETEGTNEALADLQDRCPGAFPPRAGGPPTVALKEAKDQKKVFKILREKSRPGEIWIRAVGPKERLF